MQLRLQIWCLKCAFQEAWRLIISAIDSETRPEKQRNIAPNLEAREAFVSSDEIRDVMNFVWTGTDV